MSIYDYTIKSGKGEDVALSDYKGKVMMIVNTATGVREVSRSGSGDH